MKVKRVGFQGAGVEPLHKTQNLQELSVQEREMSKLLFTGLE